MNTTFKMLFAGVIFFTLCLFIADKFFVNDGQMFQVIANLLSGFAGAMLMGIKKELGLPENGNGSSTVSQTVTASVTKEPASTAPAKEPTA